MSLEKKIKVQNEALQEALSNKKCGIHLATGMGKTKLGLDYISSYPKSFKVLIVAPKVDIFDSWKDDAKKFNMQECLENATFTTYLSLNKHNPEDYNLLILDEAHNLKFSHRIFVSNYHDRILGLTGTPPKWRSSEKGEMMVEYYPIKYVYKTDEAVKESILNDYRVIVHMLSLNSEKTVKIITKTTQFYTSELSQYNWITQKLENSANAKETMFLTLQRISLLKNFETKELFAQALLNKIPDEEKCIVFANTIAQAERLSKHSHHSKKKDNLSLEAFKLGTIKVLSAVEQLSEGINIPNLKHGILMHTYSGSSPKAKQKLGRLLRLPTDQTSTIHILCYKNTVDEKWVKGVLEDLDSSKIKYIEHSR